MSELRLPTGITAVTAHGLPAFRIETPLAAGLVYAHGAHVAEFTPAGEQPVLWISNSSLFEPGRAIRGGVPLCFPWFGPGRDSKHSPAHGFARLSTWRLTGARVDEEGRALLTLELSGAEVADPAAFPADARARLEVSMGRELTISLSVTAGASPVDFEEALHSYLAVGDARRVRIEGLEGAAFLDKVAGGRATQQGPVEFTGETDRVYLSTASCTLVDPVLRRRIVVGKTASADTVVWNPWAAKSAAMGDFGDDEWTGMCCIEAANCLDNSISLAAGESHTMATTIGLA